MNEPAHDWQPMPEPAQVPQSKCAACGLCRAQPDPTDPSEVLFWRVEGPHATKPTEDELPCHEPQE
jgi:hypothetical protein